VFDLAVLSQFFAMKHRNTNRSFHMRIFGADGIVCILVTTTRTRRPSTTTPPLHNSLPPPCQRSSNNRHRIGHQLGIVSCIRCEVSDSFSPITPRRIIELSLRWNNLVPQRSTIGQLSRHRIDGCPRRKTTTEVFSLANRLSKRCHGNAHIGTSHLWHLQHFITET